ncbi:MAG: ABC transporter substrate-binding protein [Desulfobulbus propionicus]|nr:MAG: ABC transporter substrate-binding protein [Desulfobulbus propionicus]PIE63536.1 MAG: ABC transporter substrate-binding protein [Desulfobacterales bacterium]
MARIGMVNYINTAPLYEVWKEMEHPESWQIIEGQPSELNTMLAAGEIDMGFVSSYEYAARPEQYQIFADLSISATGPVGSVYLFSKLPIEELHLKPIVLTGQSGTSVCLGRILLEEYYKAHPVYTVGDAYSAEKEDRSIAGVLAIGDDALRLRFENRYPVQLDLADAWFQQTGLPFVFSVCAVRQEYLDKHEQTARAIRETFVECRKKGVQQMAEICDRVARRIPMDCEMCSAYLNGIQHDLTADKIQGLELFYKQLVKRGEVSPASLPLKIFS